MDIFAQKYDDMVGMTFSGWYLDAALTQPVPENMPARDLVFYGRLTPNQYVLTYYLNGAYHSAQTYEYNQPIEYLSYVAQDGYTFSGWLLPDGKEAPRTMPAYNVTVYGTRTRGAGAKLDGGKLLTAGGRVLGVTETAPTLKEAIDKAYETVKSVSFGNAYYRKDIGQKALKGVN